MSRFEDRDRFTLEQALAGLKEPTNAILHLVKNEDDTYSIVGHINCEWCDYCEDSKDHAYDPSNPMIHTAKENIYEKVGR